MNHEIFLPKSEIKELHNKLNDNWVSDEEKERIKAILQECKVNPEDRMFDFNPFHALYGLYISLVLPIALLWHLIKKIIGRWGGAKRGEIKDNDATGRG